MRLSWAQGAVVALSFTAAIGLLDTPARLLGPASVAGTRSSLPRASTPSIVIAALPTPHPPASVRHANRPRPRRPPLPRCSPPSCRRCRSSGRTTGAAAQPTPPHPAAVIVAPRRRTPPDDPRPPGPSPGAGTPPTPTPAPQPTPAPTDPTTPEPTTPPRGDAAPRAGHAPTGPHTRTDPGGGPRAGLTTTAATRRLPRGERERAGRQP